MIHQRQPVRSRSNLCTKDTRPASSKSARPSVHRRQDRLRLHHPRVHASSVIEYVFDINSFSRSRAAGRADAGDCRPRPSGGAGSDRVAGRRRQAQRQDLASGRDEPADGEHVARPLRRAWSGGFGRRAGPGPCADGGPTPHRHRDAPLAAEESRGDALVLAAAGRAVVRRREVRDSGAERDPEDLADAARPRRATHPRRRARARPRCTPRWGSRRGRSPGSARTGP